MEHFEDYTRPSFDPSFTPADGIIAALVWVTRARSRFQTPLPKMMVSSHHVRRSGALAGRAVKGSLNPISANRMDKAGSKALGACATEQRVGLFQGGATVFVERLQANPQFEAGGMGPAPDDMVRHTHAPLSESADCAGRQRAK